MERLDLQEQMVGVGAYGVLKAYMWILRTRLPDVGKMEAKQTNFVH